VVLTCLQDNHVGRLDLGEAAWSRSNGVTSGQLRAAWSSAAEASAISSAVRVAARVGVTDLVEHSVVHLSPHLTEGRKPAQTWTLA
jgi:hypothetical protein